MKQPAVAKAWVLAPRGGKFIKAYTSSAVEVAIYYVAEYEEYSVQVAIGGKVNPDATYYTNDRTDAMRTAKAMFRACVIIAD